MIGVALMLGWLVYVVSVKNGLFYPLAIGSHHFHVHVPFYVGNMFHGFAFYALGAWLKEKQFTRGVFVLAMIIFFVKFVYPADMDFRSNDTGGNNYFLCVAYELSGCIVINNVFKHIANKPIKILSHVGRNSMVYYLVHYPFMRFIVSFLNPFPDVTVSVRYILLSMILIAFLVIADFVFRIKWLKWIVEGK